MNRRHLLNPCLGGLPASLAQHDLLLKRRLPAAVFEARTLWSPAATTVQPS